MTYWIYQHLGNLSPDDIDAEGLLARLQAADDGAALLREWAKRIRGVQRRSPAATASASPASSAPPSWSSSTRATAGCSRPGSAPMLDDDEWAWFTAQCDVDVDHLIIGSSLPMFVPGGLHDLQRWSEAVIDGAWGHRPFGVQQRSVEWLRRALDMEDWAAFGRSFDALVGPARPARRPHRSGAAGVDHADLRRHPLQLPRPSCTSHRRPTCAPTCTSWSTRRSATR